jgi:TP901 family phage tail tape measure protein
MGLRITAGLNYGLSLKQINEDLKILAKHPSLKKIKLGATLDKNVINEITRLSNELSKITQSYHFQNKAINDVAKSTERASNALQNEVDAIYSSNKALAENLAMRQRIVQTVEDLGDGQKRIREDIYTTVGNKFENKTTHGIRFDGGEIKTNEDEFTVVKNPEAYREAQKALQLFTDDANHRIQLLTRTFGEGSEEINKLRLALSKLTPESSKADFSRITNEIKKLEQSEKLLNQAYKENEQFNKRRQKEIDAVRDRIERLRSAIISFNRADKELPAGKTGALNNVLHSLNKIDVNNIKQANQELDKLEKTFNKLDKTASARTSLLSKLSKMKLAGVIDENEITQIENRARKAESPEQIKSLAKEYGRLYTEQVKIVEVDQKKIPLMNQLEQMRKNGLLTEKELLNFEEQISNAKTKNHIKELNQIKQRLSQREQEIRNEMALEERNAKLREQIYQRLLRMDYNALFRRARPQIEQYRNELDRLNLTSAATEKRLYEVNNELKRMQIEMQGATYKTSTFLGAFQNAMIKFPIWMGASTAFFGTVRGLRSAIQNIVEIDSQMTTLMRVSNGEIDRVRILKESADLAARLGNEMKGVNESFIDFARQGFRGEALTSLTEAATLFSNISEMTPEEAGSGLTAIIKGFNMLPEEILVAVDAINEVDNNFSVTSQNIVSAITKSVGAANTFGVSLQELIGYVTAIGQVSRESGNIIGNSLKTIFSRITTMDSSIKALEQVGVAVREIRDGVETVRPVSNILSDLASKWKELSAEQQQNIGLQIAGRYQLSRFLILMQQYDEAIKATNTALNSQGSGYRENEQYLKSFEARINMLKNAWTNLTLTMGDAVLSDTLMGIITFLNNMANNVDTLVERFGLLPTVLGTVGTLFGIFSTKARTNVLKLTEAIRSQDVAQKLATTSAFGLAKNITGATTASRVATVAITGLAGALRGLAIATGIGIIVAGVGLAVEKLISHISKANEETKRIKEENAQLTDSYINHRNKINQLIISYRNLEEERQNSTLSIEQEEEYYRITKELSELLPTLVSHIDEKGRVHLFTGDALERELKLTEELAKATADLRKQEALDKFEQNDESRLNTLKEIEKLEERIIGQQKRLDVLYSRRDELAARGKDIANVEEAIHRGESKLRTYRYELISLNRDLLRMTNGAGDYFKTLLDESAFLAGIEFGSNFKDQMYQVIDAMEFSGVTAEELNKKATDVIDLLKDDSLTEQGFLEGLKRIYSENPKVIETIDTLINRLNVTKEDIQSLIPIIDESGNELGFVKDKSEIAAKGYKYLSDETEILEDGTERLIGYIVKLAEEFDEFKSLAEVIKEPVDEIKRLNQIIDTQIQQQSLSADTIADLILKYPQLASQIEKTADGYKINSDALEVLRQVKIQEANDAIQAEIEKTKATLDNTSDRLKAYELEVDAIHSLADAMSEINKLNVSKIFGSDAFKNMLFDDENKRITVNGVTTDWSDTPELYDRIATSLKEQQRVYNILTRLGELRESQKVLSGLLNDRTYGVSNSTSKSSSSGKTLAEIELENLKKAYDEAIATIRFNTQYNEWSINQQIEAYEKLQKEHAKYLSQSLSDERDLLLTLKDLRDRSLNEEKKQLEERLKLIQDNRNAWQKNMESALDSAIELIKRHYEMQKKHALDAINTEKEALEELHNNFIKAKDEELQKYEEIVNSIIKQIDRTSEEDEFNKELKKKQEQQLKIQKRINELSLDDSFEAIAERAKLEEDLANIIEEIEEFKLRRTKELRKQSLNDNLEAKRKEIEQEKESAQYVVRVKEQLFRGTYEAAKRWLEEQAKATEAYWENEIENETRFQEMRTQALIGNLSTLQEELTNFSDNVASAMFNVGESIRQNILNEIRNVQSLLKNVGDMTSYDHEKREAWNQYLQNKKMAEDYYKATGVWDLNLKAINDELRRKYGFEDGSYEELKNKVVKFDTGGYTGKFKGEKLAFLHEKELVLDKLDTSNVLKSVLLARDLMQRISIPRLSNLTSRNETTTKHYDIKINIGKITGDRKGGETVFNTLVKELQKRGL